MQSTLFVTVRWRVRATWPSTNASPTTTGDFSRLFPSCLYALTHRHVDGTATTSSRATSLQTVRSSTRSRSRTRSRSSTTTPATLSPSPTPGLRRGRTRSPPLCLSRMLVSALTRKQPVSCLKALIVLLWLLCSFYRAEAVYQHPRYLQHRVRLHGFYRVYRDPHG